MALNIYRSEKLLGSGGGASGEVQGSSWKCRETQQGRRKAEGQTCLQMKCNPAVSLVQLVVQSVV